MKSSVKKRTFLLIISAMMQAIENNILQGNATRE